MPVTMDPIQSLPFDRASSTELLKGNALIPHTRIIWIAFGHSTFPFGFITTIIGLFLKCHSSLMNLIPAMGEKYCTTYHGILDLSISNFLRVSSFHWSTIGIHTILYCSSFLIASYIGFKIEISSIEMSTPEMNNRIFFFFNTSMLTCLSIQLRTSESLYISTNFLLKKIISTNFIRDKLIIL